MIGIIVTIFVLGYAAIALEQNLKLNKAASALITGVLCWTVYSALIIGSAAGVAAMGMEKINFFWYIKNISWLALIGFFSGVIIYILQDFILY